MGLQRTFWRGLRLNYVADEPLLVSLLRYRRERDREQVPPASGPPNLVSSLTRDGRQKPLIDLDVPHRYVRSGTPGHAHLYIDVPMGRLRWSVLQLVLWWCGVQELGYTVWSLRRGANFLRVEGYRKTLEEQQRSSAPVRYGWLFKRRGVE